MISSETTYRYRSGALRHLKNPEDLHDSRPSASTESLIAPANSMGRAGYGLGSIVRTNSKVFSCSRRGQYELVLLDIGGLLLTITDDGIPSSLLFKRVHVAVKILKNGFNAIR
jgi:hypothetical protein